jgi:ubiquinone/menaquinone biosynthesis C-methylase UbiE
MNSTKITTELSLEPEVAFDLIVDELTNSLSRKGLNFTPGPNGLIKSGDFVIGRSINWQRGRIISMDWHPESWRPETKGSLEIKFEPMEPGTLITVEHSGMEELLNGEQEELAGWFATNVLSDLVYSISPSGYGDWLTDRRARRPSGKSARGFYRDPLYHRPNFRAILAKLNLKDDDNLLEIGCGGGAFLHDALKSGCRASAIDHSEDMIRVAIQNNQEEVQQGRLKISLSDAENLDFADDYFSCAVCTGVLGFIENPTLLFREVRRVLVPGGRFVVFSGTDALKGTPAAPEPMASKIHFYTDQQLRDLAEGAGFSKTTIEHPKLYNYAKEAGVPEEQLSLFGSPTGSDEASQLLFAVK